MQYRFWICHFYSITEIKHYSITKLIKKEQIILIKHTLGIAKAGAIGKSIGSVAPSWNATMRANGFRFNSFTTFSLVSTRAAAPSLIVDAFPAVTVPFSF